MLMDVVFVITAGAIGLALAAAMAGADRVGAADGVGGGVYVVIGFPVAVAFG